MKKRPRGRPFPKGTSGNPGGRPAELVAFRLEARRHAQKALKVLLDIVVSKKAPAAARVRAVSEVFDRAFGRPAQELEVHGSMLNVEAPSPSWDDLTPDEKTDFGRRLIFLLARSAAHTKDEARGRR